MVSADVSRHVETSDGLRLAVFEDGPADAPVVVLVHGYPDNHHVWDGVALELAGRFRVVQYDVRGSGQSGVPASRAGYRIEQLVDDLARVINAVSPDEPVHLVAHDWGSIQAWDALPDDRFGTLVSSFTSISGPSLDYATVWLRDLHRGPVARLRQLLSSYYIGVFMTPALPELLARKGLIERGVGISASIRRPAELPPTAELARGEAETVNGIELYRANFPRRAGRPRPPRITLPVQVVVPSADVHVSPALASEAPVPFVEDLTVRQVDGNHWVVAQRPDAVARLVREFIESVATKERA